MKRLWLNLVLLMCASSSVREELKKTGISSSPLLPSTGDSSSSWSSSSLSSSLLSSPSSSSRFLWSLLSSEMRRERSEKSSADWDTRARSEAKQRARGHESGRQAENCCATTAPGSGLASLPDHLLLPLSTLLNPESGPPNSSWSDKLQEDGGFSVTGGCRANVAGWGRGRQSH